MACLLTEFSEGGRGMLGALASAHAWHLAGAQFRFKCMDTGTEVVSEHAGSVSGQ